MLLVSLIAVTCCVVVSFLGGSVVVFVVFVVVVIVVVAVAVVVGVAAFLLFRYCCLRCYFLGGRCGSHGRLVGWLVGLLTSRNQDGK